MKAIIQNEGIKIGRKTINQGKFGRIVNHNTNKIICIIKRFIVLFIESI